MTLQDARPSTTSRTKTRRTTAQGTKTQRTKTQGTKKQSPDDRRPSAQGPTADATDRARGSRRPAPVLEATEEHPLGDVGGRVRRGIAIWLRSPALDFYALAVIGGLLLGLGLVMVLSSSSVLSIAKGESGYTGLWRQGRFLLIGLPLLVIAAAVPLRWYQRFAPYLLVLGFILQLLVFVPHLGVDVQGNRNWIRVGSMQLQPSELLKLSLVVWLGTVLGAQRKKLTDIRFLRFPIAPVLVVAIGLVVAGHDLGTAMIMCMLVAGALWVAGLPRRWFAGAAVLGVVGVLGLTFSSANRMARIANWMHGECAGSTCWQSEHGMFALAEGGWWGVGLGESRQKWGLLPAADNDFIFAIIGEELGLLGTLGVLVLFALLALVLFRMITRMDDPFVQVTVGGVTAWILGQAFTNMMVVTGMLPVLGVPLPFISAGGSALVTSMLTLGMLLCFARHEPGAAEALSARIGRVRRGATIVPAPIGTVSRTGSTRAGVARARRESKRTAKAARRSSPTSAEAETPTTAGSARTGAMTAGRTTAPATPRNRTARGGKTTTSRSGKPTTSRNGNGSGTASRGGARRTSRGSSRPGGTR